MRKRECAKPEKRGRGPCGGGRGRRMFDAGTLRYVVLQRIAEQPRHGYEIIKAIEVQSGGAYTPSAGMIYPMLSMMEELGYITATLTGSRKLYSITDTGRAFLNENRAFVDAVEARMNSRRVACSAAVRQGMQDIKDALAAHVHGQDLSEERLNKVRTILSKAAADIQRV